MRPLTFYVLHLLPTQHIRLTASFVLLHGIVQMELVAMTVRYQSMCGQNLSALSTQEVALLKAQLETTRVAVDAEEVRSSSFSSLRSPFFFSSLLFVRFNCCV